MTKSGKTVKYNYYHFMRPIVKYLKSVLKSERIILLVDDEKSNSKSVKNIISSHLKRNKISDTRVIYVYDPIEALYLLMMDCFFQGKVKLIISDLNMKNKNSSMTNVNSNKYSNLNDNIKYKNVSKHYSVRGQISAFSLLPSICGTIL